MNIKPVPELTVVPPADSDSLPTTFGTVLRTDDDTVGFTPNGSTTEIVMIPGESCLSY